MTAVTLRSVKGAPLEWSEVDDNFTALRDGAQQLLTANLNLYVRTNGSDSNLGNANTAGGAFLTIQRALNEGGKYETSNFPVVVNVAAGTYTGAVFFPGAANGFGLDFDLIGDVATPSNVVINGNIRARNVNVKFSGFQVTANNSIGSAVNAQVQVYNCKFVSAYFTTATAGYIYIQAVEVTGNIFGVLFANSGGLIEVDSITVTGTPAYSSSFCGGEASGSVYFYNAPVGSATGKRYNISLNTIIQTYGGGANYLPGDVAGTTATGGQYV